MTAAMLLFYVKNYIHLYSPLMVDRKARTNHTV